MEELVALGHDGAPDELGNRGPGPLPAPRLATLTAAASQRGKGQESGFRAGCGICYCRIGKVGGECPKGFVGPISVL